MYAFTKSIDDVCTGENTYLRTWGLKREEGICSRGVYFLELTVPLPKMVALTTEWLPELQTS